MNSMLFDTNALVYWVHAGSAFHEDVSALVRKMIREDSAVYALTSSLNDVHYIMRRQYANEEEAREAVRDIAETFDLVDLAGPFVFAALDSDEPNYEDGVIRTAAEALQVSAIISYDRKAFRDSLIPRKTAGEMLEVLIEMKRG